MREERTVFVFVLLFVKPQLTWSTLCFSESSNQKPSSQPEGGDFDHVPNKRRKQFLSALVALGAMLSYAFLTGMVSIQHVQHEALEEPPDLQTIGSHEEEGDG